MDFNKDLKVRESRWPRPL